MPIVRLAFSSKLNPIALTKFIAVNLGLKIALLNLLIAIAIAPPWSHKSVLYISPGKLVKQALSKARFNELYLVCPSLRLWTNPASTKVFEWWQNSARLISNWLAISDPLISSQLTNKSTICSRVGSERAANTLARCSWSVFSSLGKVTGCWLSVFSIMARSIAEATVK